MVKSENNKIKKEPSKSLGSKSISSSPLDSNKKRYKGVRMRSWGSYVSEIRAPNQKTRIWLGSYSTAEAAARAYDAALLCLKGSSATNLNFPSSSSSIFIPQDTVMSPKSIQKIAASAANNSFVENHNSTSCTPVFTSSTPVSTTSSSLVSSPSMSSSPYDDDVSLFPIQSFGCNESMAMMDSWFGFDSLQSPKHVDQILNGDFFDIDSTQVLLNDWYEEGDISLWNFC